MNKVILFFFALTAAYGGKSLEVGVNAVRNTSVSAPSSNRLEVYVDSFTPPSVANHLLNGAGWGVIWYPTRVEFYPTNTNASGPAVNIDTSKLGSGFYIRMQRDITLMRCTVEAWSPSGSLIASGTIPFTTYTAIAGEFNLGPGGEATRTIAFARMHTNVLPMGSRMPTTVDDGNRVFEWKFDNSNNSGSLTDNSGNGITPSMFVGSATYSTTLNQNTIAVIATAGHPAWSSIVSQRAGDGIHLDGSSSFSQDDASASVTYFWQLLSGPSQLNWGSSGHTSPAPVLSGSVFGDYLFQLVATSPNGLTNTTSAHVGVVSMDTNGVVVNADPNVDRLLGPQIAFGKNPWGFEDYLHKHAMEVRSGPDGLGATNTDGSIPSYKKLGWYGTRGHPMWQDMAVGTLAYYWNGVGEVFGHHAGASPKGTTLAAQLNPTDGTVTVTNAGELDLSDLPTIIEIHNDSVQSGGHELVHILSYSGNVLTIDYDGRGETCANNIGCAATPTWPSGSLVAQFKVKGAGTQFLTDPVAPVCPLGKGMPGPSYYSTGTVSLSPGSTTLTGSGTNWVDTFQNVYVGKFLQVTATHGGTPFVFVSRITHVTDTTHITLARTYPSTADTLTNVTYSILKASRSIDARYPVLVDPTHSTDGQVAWGTRWCQTETEAYLDALVQGPSVASGHDNGYDGTQMSGLGFSVIDDLTSYVNGVAGISFYGESIGSRTFYYSSGLDQAKNAATVLEDGWANSPFGNPEISGFPPLIKGGQGIGSFINAILTHETNVSWSIARTFAAAGETIVNAMVAGTQNYDSRDQGYQTAWLVLAALFDPDTTTATHMQDGTPVTGFRTRWRNDLATVATLDANIRQADHSWANYASYFNGLAPSLTTTQGSSAVTGTGIPAALCSGVTAGTGTVTAGSATLTITSGTIPTGNAATTTVIVSRCDSGTCPPTAEPSTTVSLVYTGSGSSVTMSALWPGSGTAVPVTWMAATSAIPMMAIGKASNSYEDMRRNYNCIWNSATSITLDRPWFGYGGVGGSGYQGSDGSGQALFGYGQQPFMLGLKVYYMWLLSRAVEITGDSSLASIAAIYSASSGYTADATTWLRDNGVDEQNTKGLYYGRVFQFCEPPTIDSGAFGDSGYRTLGCAYSMGVSSIVPVRQLTQEIANAYGALYTALPTTPNKTFGDNAYARFWGNAQYDDPSVAALNDHLTVAENLGASNMLDNFLDFGKYYGQEFGMGFPRQWPAIRQGGVAPADTKTIKIPFRLANVTNASEVAITVTEPNGLAHSAAVCTASPCSVSADARQGNHLYKVDYRNSSHAVIAPGENIPLYVR